MTNLFIIGNGFDLSHNLPTHYDNFREYLRTTYTYRFDEEPIELAEGILGPSGEMIYDDDMSVHYLDHLITLANDYETWADFENSLAFLDYSIVEETIQTIYDNEGDIQPFHTGANYEDTYEDLSNIINQIPVLFSEWIHSIRISEYSYHYPPKIVHSFKNIIDPDEDIFLTFNYTTTLESLYEAQNVTHIHGCQNEDEELIVGHNIDLPYEEEAYQQDIYKRKMQERLRKNVELCLNNNEVFFYTLEDSDIDAIYSYGFSFADVDLDYIQKIINSIDTSNITWFFESYPEVEELSKYRDKLLSLGFKGDFNVF